MVLATMGRMEVEGTVDFKFSGKDGADATVGMDGGGVVSLNFLAKKCNLNK